MALLAAALSFMIGSIPFAVLVTRHVGVDVRTMGSGNPGFANSIRAIGIMRALPILVADIGKGWCGASLALALGGGWWAAVLVIIGHCFSPWLRFRGGKGVATLMGVAFAAHPYIAIIGILMWGFIFAVFRAASLASLLSVVTIAAGVWWLLPVALIEFTAAAALIFLKHRKNISRLWHGTELTFKF
jgi:acyl phosphate:glycerol-3-phosphate acyltransferase